MSENYDFLLIHSWLGLSDGYNQMVNRLYYVVIFILQHFTMCLSLFTHTRTHTHTLTVAVGVDINLNIFSCVMCKNTIWSHWCRLHTHTHTCMLGVSRNGPARCVRLAAGQHSAVMWRGAACCLDILWWRDLIAAFHKEWGGLSK